MAKALGLKSDGGNAFMKTLSGKTIRSNISEKLWERIENPIIFKPLNGDPSHGYEADVLIEICGLKIRIENQTIKFSQPKNITYFKNPSKNPSNIQLKPK